ncbi:uncharacterized protein LOC144574069 isoform X3 [Carex rostrata]
MSSNLAVDEPMAADPAKNPVGDEPRVESAAVESTEEVEIRGSVETTEEKTTVVVTETKVEILGSELGSESKSAGGLQGDDLLEVSQREEPSCVESSFVGGVEEGNDPTEISLHDLTGGLDIDGKPTGGDMEEVVMEATVENEMDLVPSSTEIAGETKDGLVGSLSDEQIQVPESRPTGTILEQPELEGSIDKEAGLVEGIQEDKTAEDAGEYTSDKELGEEHEKERRLVDGDKTADNLETQITVEVIKDVITPMEKVIEACDTVKVLEEGAEELSAKSAAIGQSEEVTEKNNDTVEESEEVVKEAISDPCIEPMDVAPQIESSAGPTQIVGIEDVSASISEQLAEVEQPDALVLETHVPMDIDGAINSETMETESGKEIGGDNWKLDAEEVGADQENSKLGESGPCKEKKPASSLEENNIAHADGKEAVVYHRREKHQTTKNATPSPELQKEETIPGEIPIAYNLPSVENDGFAISDLVWGKVKSHPWWPGVIINPSDGSNLAMKYQKRDAFLVAYFGDKTFAWCDESQLKPFFPNFSHFEKQASTDAFSNAVKSVLVEVSRRFEVASICSCLDEKLFAKEVYPKLENAGVRQGFVNCSVDRYEMVKYFNPKGLVDFIKDLALDPIKVTTDKLELVMVTSQIKAFYQSKGYSVPPRYQTFGPLEDYIEPVIVLSKSEKLPENSVMQVQTLPAVTLPDVTPSVIYTPVELGTVEKPKRKRGRPPKKKKEEVDIEVQKPLSELVQKKVHSNLANGSRSNSKPEKTTTDEEDSASPLPWKKRKEVLGFDLVEHENQAQTPRSSGFGVSFKIGACISRAASRLTGSGSGSSPLISTPKVDNADFDVSSDDETPVLTTNEEKRVRRRRLKKYHYSDPNDVLSQLCLVATGPRKEYSFLGTVVSYFTDFRNFIVNPPPSTEMDHVPEKVKLRRGRKRKVDLPQITFDEVVTPTDHMQDSYWSDMILCGQTEEPSSWPKQRKRRAFIDTKQLKLSPGGPDAKRALAVAAAATKRSIIRVEEKRLDECNPTALLLSFGTRYGTVPSEMDIVRIFSRYGPLKEWEMGKVEGSANRAWIVFKRRADAEMAFSSLRKQNVFGPSLLSYRLVYEVPEKSEQEKKVGALNGEEHKIFDLQAPEETVNLPSVTEVDLSINVEGVDANEMLVDPLSNVEGSDVVQGDNVDTTPVDLSSNVESVGADEMLVDPLSNVEGSDVVQGDNVDTTAIDPSSNIESVDADLFLVNPSSNVEIVHVAEGDYMNEVPVDQSVNVKDGHAVAMSIDPSSTAQVEAVNEISVDPSSNMQVDTETKISVDCLSTVQNEAVDEIFADPSSTAKVDAVSEAAVEPPVIVHVEAVGDVSVTPSSTVLEEGVGQPSMNTSRTVHVDAVHEVLADESGSVQDDNAVVETINLPSTEQDEVTVAKSVGPSCAVQCVAVSSNQSNTVQNSDIMITESNTMQDTEIMVTESKTVQDTEIMVTESDTVPSQNCGQTDPPSILYSEIISDVSTVPANAEEGEDVGVTPVETINTEQCEAVGEMPAESASSEQGIQDGEIPVQPSSTRESEAVDELSLEPASTRQGEVVGVSPVEASNIKEGEVPSTGEGEAVAEMPVDPSSTAQGEVVGEPPVEASSIEEGEEVTIGLPLDPSSTAQGEVLSETPVMPAGTEQVEEDEKEQVETAGTEQVREDGEEQVEPAGTVQVKADDEEQVAPVGMEQVKEHGEERVEPATKQVREDGEDQVAPAGTEQDSERPVEQLNTEEGEVVGEMSLEPASAE